MPGITGDRRVEGLVTAVTGEPPRPGLPRVRVLAAGFILDHLGGNLAL